MHKVLIPIKNTYYARKWCYKNIGEPEYTQILHKRGGYLRVMNETKSSWTCRKNKRTSTFKFKSEEHAIWFKLIWYDSVEKDK